MGVVAVLGAGGFIGANLVKRLVDDGHKVRAVDVHFPAFRRGALDGASCWTLDLRGFPAAVHAVDGCDWVFHLAADMGGVGFFHSPADLAASLTNGLITNNVLAAVLNAQTPRLFYAASACCYPVELMQHGATPLTEAQIGFGTPDALYGAEKLHGLRLCSKVPGARVGVFDTIYGPLQEHEGRRMKFPAAVATKALAARLTGRLELWGDGSQSRCYMYVDDAVEKVLRIMQADDYAGPVNVGSGVAVTCREVAEMALEHVGADAEIVTNPDEPSGVLARALDHSKFDATYGPVPETPVKDGMGRFIDSLEPMTATRTPPRQAVARPTIR